MCAVAYSELRKVLASGAEVEEKDFSKYPDPDGLRAQWYYENVSSEMHADTARQVRGLSLWCVCECV